MVKTIEIFAEPNGSGKTTFARSKSGGHDVENKIVKWRFKRTFENMMKLYSQLADGWYLINNSGKLPEIIAYSEEKKTNILDQKTHNKLFQ